MSIITHLQWHAFRGDLVEVVPTLPAPTRRRLYAAPEVAKAVDGPWANDEQASRCGLLRREFDRFVEGRIISLALDPFDKARDAYMAIVAPERDLVFDIRVRAPDDGIRVFGHFAEKDVFVALSWNFREALPERRDWRDERELCKAKWRNLCHQYTPHGGASVHDYISDKVVPC